MKGPYTNGKSNGSLRGGRLNLVYQYRNPCCMLWVRARNGVYYPWRNVCTQGFMWRSCACTRAPGVRSVLSNRTSLRRYLTLTLLCSMMVPTTKRVRVGTSARGSVSWLLRTARTDSTAREALCRRVVGHKCRQIPTRLPTWGRIRIQTIQVNLLVWRKACGICYQTRLTRASMLSFGQIANTRLA